MALLDKLAKQIADSKEPPKVLEVSPEDGPRFTALLAGFAVPEVAPGTVSVGTAPAGVLGFFRGIPVSVRKPVEADAGEGAAAAAAVNRIAPVAPTITAGEVRRARKE